MKMKEKNNNKLLTWEQFHHKIKAEKGFVVVVVSSSTFFFSSRKEWEGTKIIRRLLCTNV